MKRNITLSTLVLSALLLCGCAQAPEQPEFIEPEGAKSLTLQTAEPTSGQAEFSNAAIAIRNGVDDHEVSSSADGKVIEDTIERKAASPVSKLLTEEQAKDKALTHAGIKAGDVKFVQCRLGKEDKTSVYDVEFYSGNKEYDYEVDAYTGKILEFDHDMEHHSPAAQSSPKTSITAAEAKKLALARVNGAQLKDIREFETDRDDGRLEYEGTILYQEKEYEFEIDGSSGTIRSWEVESIYD